VRARNSSQWPLAEGAAARTANSLYSVFVADDSVGGKTNPADANTSVTTDVGATGNQPYVVGWQSVRGRTKKGRVTVQRLDNGSDPMFGGRRVIILDEDRSLGMSHDSTLYGIAHPYIFDDLVLVARMMISPNKKNVPSPSDVFSPRFMQAIRSGARCNVHASRPDFFRNESVLKVAMHVRRGDVDHNNKHYLPDSYFTSIASTLRNHYHKPDIHVFSSTEKKCSVPNALTMEDCERGELLYNEKSFSSFTKSNIPVHLDGDTHVAWSHFIRADVFVMSPSGFSNPPGFLNAKCVVWLQSNWTPMRLPHWITAKDLTNKAAVDRCLKGPSDVKSGPAEGALEMRTNSTEEHHGNKNGVATKKKEGHKHGIRGKLINK
jgi:hypothetical protein